MAGLKTRNEIRFMLNGEHVALTKVAPDETLLDWLRLERSLRGTKEGCAEGDCGACTVLVGRLSAGRLVYESVNACIRFLGSLDGTHIVTVEHLRGDGDRLHPVQQAMVDFHASQCGFCTPGFVMSLYALWMRSPEPSDAAIEKALQGNLCRCTGYEAIVRAARAISSYGKAAKDPLAAERKAIAEKLAAMKDGARIEIGAGNQRLMVPANADDLAAVLDKEPGATIVAGSTDVGLWVTKHMRDIAPAIFIGNLDGLCGISEDKGVISIGAGVTYTEAFSTLAKRVPALGPLFDRIGGDQVRRGNKRRTIPLEDFFIAYGKQDRQPGEFVEAVHVPVPDRDTKFAVYKITKRRDEDITAALGAFLLTLARDGTVAEVRIAYGGMAATPKRAFGVEKALLGKPWTEATVEAA
ncbi:MAG: xanthine dehydrogenase small subunit, partial [Mesorhizobium sp.]